MGRFFEGDGLSLIENLRHVRRVRSIVYGHSSLPLYVDEVCTGSLKADAIAGTASEGVQRRPMGREMDARANASYQYGVERLKW